MTDYSGLDSANRFLGKVADWIRDRSNAVGVDAWNFDPAQRQARERSVRVLVRSVNRVDREAGALIRSGVPEQAVRERAFRRAPSRTPAHARASR